MLGLQLEIPNGPTPPKTTMLLGAAVAIMRDWGTAKLPDRERKEFVSELARKLWNGTRPLPRPKSGADGTL